MPEITDERIAELKKAIDAGEGVYLSPRIPQGDPGQNIADELYSLIARLERAEADKKALEAERDAMKEKIKWLEFARSFAGSLRPDNAARSGASE